MDKEKLGFTRVKPGSLKRRAILSLKGPPKSGKTYWGLAAPGPIAHFDSDWASESAREKFAAEKEIYRYEIKTAREIEITNSGPNIEAEEEYNKFREAYYACLRDPGIRTVFGDTGTEIWELLRLAFFGRLTQVPPMKYAPANEEYRKLIRAAYDTDKNLILTHRVKDEYVGDMGSGTSVRTGKKILSGFADTPYLVQANLTTYWDRETREFGVFVEDCGYNMAIAGEQFQGEVEGISMCSFSYLASSMFPNTTPEDWL